MTLREASLEVAESEVGVRLRHTQVDDFPIRAGLSDAALGYPSQQDPSSLPDMASVAQRMTESLRANGLTMTRFMDLQFASEIGVNPVIEGVRSGTANLHIGIVPVENQDGQMSQTITVTVREQ
jgi:hypothetical protein